MWCLPPALLGRVRLAGPSQPLAGQGGREGEQCDCWPVLWVLLYPLTPVPAVQSSVGSAALVAVPLLIALQRLLDPQATGWLVRVVVLGPVPVGFPSQLLRADSPTS